MKDILLNIWYFIRGLFIFPIFMLGIVVLIPFILIEGIWMFGINQDLFWYTPILDRWFKFIDNIRR